MAPSLARASSGDPPSSINLSHFYFGPNQMTLGQRLRAARESHRMTVGDVARRTYMQPRFLQAIEEDNVGIIPESHRRLFVREFARTVGLDPEELYPLLDAISPPTSRPQTASTSATPTYTFVDGEEGTASAPATTISTPSLPRRTERSLPDADRPTFGTIVRGVTGGLRGGGDREERGPRTLILIGGILIVLVGGYFLIKALTGKEATPPPSTVDSAAGVSVLPRNDSAAVSPTDDGADDDSLTLVGRTTGRVWFSIVADNKRSESGTLDSGVEKRWRAATTFRLSLSNAGDLPLSLNGRSLGTLGAKKTSIRNVTIDSAGVRGATTAPRTPARSTTRRAAPRSASPRRTTPPVNLPPTNPQ